MEPHKIQQVEQPGQPQQIPHQPRPQALLHLHACPVAAAARNTCSHTDNINTSDCTICQVFTHDEAARKGWLPLLCICEMHNPHPRLNTPAGRYKLDEAVRRTGAKELVALSWARGTVSALAEVLDANLERVLQARIAGRDSIAEDDARVINGAAGLMGRILPYMLGTQGDFCIDDERIFVQVPERRPSQQEGQKCLLTADDQRRQAGEAYQAFEEFERRVEKDLEFIGSEQKGDQSPFYKKYPDMWVLDRANIHEKYLREKYGEAERSAMTSMLKQQLMRPNGAQEQQQEQPQASPAVVNGSTPSPTTATAPASVTATTSRERQQSPPSQPKAKVPAPQVDRKDQQLANVKAIRSHLRRIDSFGDRWREEQAQKQQAQKIQGPSCAMGTSISPKSTAAVLEVLMKDTRAQQEAQPRDNMAGYHQPAYPGSWLQNCGQEFPIPDERTGLAQQQPQKQSYEQQPANPPVVNGSSSKPPTASQPAAPRANTHAQQGGAQTWAETPSTFQAHPWPGPTDIAMSNASDRPMRIAGPSPAQMVARNEALPPRQYQSVYHSSPKWPNAAAPTAPGPATNHCPYYRAEPYRGPSSEYRGKALPLPQEWELPGRVPAAYPTAPQRAQQGALHHETERRLGDAISELELSIYCISERLEDTLQDLRQLRKGLVQPQVSFSTTAAAPPTGFRSITVPDPVKKADGEQQKPVLAAAAIPNTSETNDVTMKSADDADQPQSKDKGKGKEKGEEQNPPLVPRKGINGHEYKFVNLPVPVSKEDEPQEIVVGPARSRTASSTASSLPDLEEVTKGGADAHQPVDKGKGKETGMDQLTEKNLSELLAPPLYATNHKQARPAPSPCPPAAKRHMALRPHSYEDFLASDILHPNPPQPRPSWFEPFLTHEIRPNPPPPPTSLEKKSVVTGGAPGDAAASPPVEAQQQKQQDNTLQPSDVSSPSDVSDVNCDYFSASSGSGSESWERVTGAADLEMMPHRSLRSRRSTDNKERICRS